MDFNNTRNFLRGDLKTTKLKTDDLIMFYFISHTLIPLFNLVDGYLILVFMFACVCVLAAAGGCCVRV